MTRRLCYFIDTEAVGGAERYLADLINEMSRRKYDVTVICHPHPGLLEFFKKQIPGSCQIFTAHFPSVTRNKAIQSGLKINRSSKGMLAWLKIPGLLLFYWNTFICFLKIRPLLKQARPDIFHINAGGYPASESNRAAVLAGRSLSRRIMTVHNQAPQPPISETWIDSAIQSSLDQIITVSQDSKNALVKNREFAPDLIQVIYLGVEPAPQATATSLELRQELGVPLASKLIGHIGGLQPRKGQAFLIDSFKDICGQDSLAHLVIMGSGPCEAELREQVQTLGLGKRVTLTGYKANARRFLPSFDVFAFSSLSHEGLPYVILEAMQAGLPIAATRVGGTPEEITDQESGLLVPPGDRTAMAKALSTLTNDSTFAKRLGKAAQERIERHFQIDRMFMETEQLYS